MPDIDPLIIKSVLLAIAGNSAYDAIKIPFGALWSRFSGKSEEELEVLIQDVLNNNPEIYEEVKKIYNNSYIQSHSGSGDNIMNF